ncbi:type I restriction endonuclease [Polaromonas hydrogenivorans]|uniref:type I restriction endonuclease n=1 Tax=Polaromonas hydrogenivorans TaxID=335476 RepID=UPI0039EF621F
MLRRRSQYFSGLLVLFLNGIPVVTIELKTETTQFIEAAMRQYRKDRKPVSSVTKTTSTSRAWASAMTFLRWARSSFAPEAVS